MSMKCLKTRHGGRENAAQEERGGVTAKEQRGRYEIWRGLRSTVQVKMHLLLTPTVGATAQPAAPGKTHGNESDLRAPKLKVSHYVGVAMEAE